MMTLFQLYLLFVGSLFAAVFSLAWAVVAMPADDVPPLGLRGMARAQAREKSGPWRAVQPFVQWMGARVAPMLSRKQTNKLDQMLSSAGDPLGMMPAELVVLGASLGFLGLSFGVLYSSSGGHSPLFVPISAGLMGSLPFLRISSTADSRLAEIRRSLPTMVDLLCLSLSAGKDFPGAVRSVVENRVDRVIHFALSSR